MSEGWNIQELRWHLKDENDDMEDALGFVASLARKFQIYQYHLYTAKDAMKGVVKEGEASAKHNIRFVFGNAENQGEYNLAKIVNEANLIGSLYSIRASFDILSQLINVLILGRRFSDNECDIHKVQSAMASSSLKTELDQALTNKWFLYVSDFVNTTKHRRLMTHKFSVHFDKPGCGIYIEGFKYRNRSHPEYSDEEILKGTVEVSRYIVDCGKRLNDQVIHKTQK